MATHPLVSVLITSYNREAFIAESIESILASTYNQFELIVVDDCSTDGTAAIANHYAEQDSRIQVFVNEKNLGQFANRNKAATYASGKYIKYVDSDDTIHDFGLAYCVEQMERFPEAAFGTYCAQGVPAGEAACWSSEKVIREHFFGHPKLFIGPSGTIINRQKFLASGGFDGRFGVPSDVYFNIRMASMTPVVLLPELFVFYRRHEGQEINNQLDYLRYGYLYLKELLENTSLPLTKKEIGFLYRKMKKRHAVNLFKYLLKTKNVKETWAIMRQTQFHLSEGLFSLFF